MTSEIRNLPKSQRIAAFQAWVESAGDFSDAVWLGMLEEFDLEPEDVIDE